MTIYEFADKIGADLTTTRLNSGGGYHVYFVDTAVDLNNMHYCGAVGKGPCAEWALADFVNNISGKRIAVFARGFSARTEHRVPKDLEW